MRSSEPEAVEFDPTAPGPVIEHMTVLAEAGRGWINLHPGVDEEDPPPPQSGFLRVFSGRGPATPLCTWVARERTRKGVEYVSVGVQHAAGPKAVDRLADRGYPLPARTLVLADHPKRGLVVAFGVEERHEVVLGWLVGAAERLCDWPLRSPWLAIVHPG
ncbi:MAG: hypothetical protein ACRD0U_21030 [Acidimicrobiales bacterium]